MSSIKHRHLGRSSAHRQAMLKNLITSLVEQESIRTTWPRAKEAQRMADKLITLAKRNTIAARSKAQGMLFRPDIHLPKLFGPLRERYATRPGGYTRVLRTEPLDRDTKHATDDPQYNPGQNPSAILEFVDGPRDMRFAMTARALVKTRNAGDRGEEEKGSGAGVDGKEKEGVKGRFKTPGEIREILAANIRKVTRFRENGDEVLAREVERLEELQEGRRRVERRERKMREKEADEW